MPRIRTLTLTPEQKAELIDLCDRQPKAYLRERAAALLKIAEDGVPRQVASSGLLKVRDPDSVYAWLDAYEAQGCAGLVMKSGRGRKPCFSPLAANGGSSQNGGAPCHPAYTPVLWPSREPLAA